MLLVGVQIGEDGLAISELSMQSPPVTFFGLYIERKYIVHNSQTLETAYVSDNTNLSSTM